MRNQQTVIVKKSPRRANGENGGGGAWKVAFADFTLAMMALFLILWLLSITDEQERRMVSSSLRNYSIFDASSDNPFELSRRTHLVELENRSALVESIASELLANNNPTLRDESLAPTVSTISPIDGNAIDLDSFFRSPFESADSLSMLADIVVEMGRQLSAYDNLAVDLVPQGLRIRLQDNNDRQMFARGGSKMDPFFEDMLLSIAPVFARIENSLVISGHTDAVPYHGSRYSNWELSGDRALMARKVLEIGGTPVSRVLQVAAMADRTLARPEDPLHSANRRIEILVLTPQAEQELLGLFDSEVTGSALNEARESALQNQPVTR